MLITQYCNLIGTANVPAAHTKTCPNTPDVFSPLPSFRLAQLLLLLLFIIIIII